MTELYRDLLFKPFSTHISCSTHRGHTKKQLSAGMVHKQYCAVACSVKCVIPVCRLFFLACFTGGIAYICCRCVSLCLFSCHTD